MHSDKTKRKFGQHHVCRGYQNHELPEFPKPQGTLVFPYAMFENGFLGEKPI
jgi:hypothetical protein